MKLRTRSAAIFAIACALGLVPGAAFAAETNVGSDLQAGALNAQSLTTQSTTLVDSGWSGTCDWFVYIEDGRYYLRIQPSDGEFGWLEPTYYDSETDGSTAPWYPYADKLTGAIIVGEVLAPESCACMFCDCTNIRWIGLTGFDASEVMYMQDMFYGCESLGVIYVGKNWSLDSLVDSTDMFYGCYSLMGGNGTRFNPNYVDSWYAYPDLPGYAGYLTSLYLGHATVYLDKASFTYDSKTKQPAVGVAMGLRNLTLGTDYTVTYKNNKNPGTATVVVKAAQGSIYEGSKSKKFTIKKANVANGKITLAKASSPYTGKVQKGTVKKLVVGGRTLKAGTDFTVAAVSGKNVGSYTVKVKGKGNYTGTKTIAFKVTAAANSAKAASTRVTKTMSLGKVKTATQTVALPKVATKFGKAKWVVASKDAKKVLSLSDGKVKVKKSAKKGTYTIKVKGIVAKAKNYKAATTKPVTVQVTVK